VLGDLRRRCRSGDHVVILAGERYRKHLVPALKDWGCDVSVPVEGLGIGRQLGRLNKHTKA
jgi:uncharacterized protein DUF6884